MTPPPTNPQTDPPSGRLVSIVVPTYKEAQNIRPLASAVAEAMADADRPYEIIVVDDDSRDGTDREVAALSQEGHPITLITRTGRRDLSTAVIHGFRQSSGDVLVCMDADLSHPPRAVVAMLARLERGDVNFVIGSRYVPGASTDERWGIIRKLNSMAACLLARPFTAVKDPMSGFFALGRSLFESAAKLEPVGYKIALELLVKCPNVQAAEIPIHFAARKFGKSKLSLAEQIKYVKHIKRLIDHRWGGSAQLLQFCVVGFTGMIVDMTMLAAFMFLLKRLGMQRFVFEVANAMAIWVAMTWNFYLNRRLTFSYSRKGSILSQYPRYVAACALGAVVQWSVATALVRALPATFDAHKFVAKFLGIVVGTICNFLISRYWVFKRLADKA